VEVLAELYLGRRRLPAGDDEAYAMVAAIQYIETRLVELIEVGVARGIVKAFDG
jgi:hypothetical protein